MEPRGTDDQLADLHWTLRAAARLGWTDPWPVQYLSGKPSLDSRFPTLVIYVGRNDSPKEELMILQRRLIHAALALTLAGAAFLSRSAFGWDCYTYTNSAPGWVTGYGPTCMGTGPGCRECTSGGSGGYTVCIDSTEHPACLDYPDTNL